MGPDVYINSIILLTQFVLLWLFWRSRPFTEKPKPKASPRGQWPTGPAPTFVKSKGYPKGKKLKPKVMNESELVAKELEQAAAKRRDNLLGPSTTELE